MMTFSKWGRGVLPVALCLMLMGAPVSAKDIVDTAVDAGSFKTLAAALNAAGLVDALKSDGPFTVFAPTDDAFAKLPAGTIDTLLKPENKQQLVDILTYHVVAGQVPASDVVELTGATTLNGQRIEIAVDNGTVKADDATVTSTDIVCTNGVIHVIDSVLLPATDNIAVTAEKAGTFKTLLAAASAAGLDGALTGEGPLTVFAPTDEAFANLPEGTVESLLQPENRSKLAAILKYHVVPGRVYSTDAVAAGSAETLQGDRVSITVESDGAKVNDSNLVATDLDASNGVIHVIDAVLLPPQNDSTAAMPRRMIEAAINEGAPLFNSGHPSACAQLYMSTARDILSMNDHGLSSSATHRLTSALQHCGRQMSANSRAWTMRHALDYAYNDLR